MNAFWWGSGSPMLFLAVGFWLGRRGEKLRSARIQGDA